MSLLIHKDLHVTCSVQYLRQWTYLKRSHHRHYENVLKFYPRQGSSLYKIETNFVELQWNFTLQELLVRLESEALETGRTHWRPNRQNDIQNHTTAKIGPQMSCSTSPTLACGPPSWPGPQYRSILLILIIVNKRYHLLILLLLKELVLHWTLLCYNSLQTQGLKHKHLIDPGQVTSPNVGIQLVQWRSCAQALTARNLKEEISTPTLASTVGTNWAMPPFVY